MNQLSSADSDSNVPAPPSYYSLGQDLEDTLKPGEISQLSSERSLSFPIDFGAYQLLELIGSGGMGSVFRAKKKEGGPFVAIKVLHRGVFASDIEIQRFEKESRIHAQIQSPFVVRHIEFNRVHQQHYIVSEFIEGIGLEQLVGRVVKLGQRCALVVIRDVLKAIATMHEAGIIHRDVKPSNVMVICKSKPNQPFTTEQFQQAKLMDFGVAREISQSESMAITQTQTTLGTPLYMAPEQQEASREVSPESDIYSVGATLYHLLAGFPPFESQSRHLLTEMHRIEKPKKLTHLHLGISEAVQNIVLKAMEKEPAMRYANGREMLDDVEHILAGRPTSIRMYPTVPNQGAPQIRTFAFQWTMDVARAALWPLIADTDRFNRAIHLPPPRYAFKLERGERKLLASAKFMGMSVRWREHPFQWIAGQEMSVLREFEAGPFAWVASTVYLESLRGDQTRLIHEFKVMPRGVFGRMLTPIQFGFVTKRQLDKVYRRIEQLARLVDGPLSCDAPFTNPLPFTSKQSKSLEQAGAVLKQQTAVKGHLLAGLIDYLQDAADANVGRIRPKALAKKMGCDDDELLRLCLNATTCGILRLSWDVICPACRIATTNKALLRDIASFFRCDVCDLDFETDFANSVELVFSVHPQIRKVDTRTYCIGGPFHSPHVIAQNQLSPDESLEMGMQLSEDKYAVRSPQLDGDIMVVTNNEHDDCRLAIELPVDCFKSLVAARSYVSLRLHNQSERNLVTRLESAVERHDSISAAEIGSHPEFRRLFPSQVRSPDDLMSMNFAFVIAIRVFNFDRLLELKGEVGANHLWRELLKQCYDKGVPARMLETSYDRCVLESETMSNTIHTVNFMHRELKQLGCEVGCVINRGLLHSVNSGALGSKVFGKTVRETQQLSEILTVDQFIVNDVVRNHSENVDSILDPWQLTLDPSTIVADKGFEGFSVYLVVRQNQE